MACFSIQITDWILFSAVPEYVDQLGKILITHKVYIQAFVPILGLFRIHVKFKQIVKSCIMRKTIEVFVTPQLFSPIELRSIYI